MKKKEKFSWKKYMEILDDPKYDDLTRSVKADIYCADYIPTTLYKYISLRKKRKKILNDLSNEKLWFSKVSALNDPFEFKKQIIDFSQIGEGVEEYYNKSVMDNCVLSLSSDCKSKLLWSHYADSHNGICVEIKCSISGSNVIPVEYVNKRPDLTSAYKQFTTIKGTVNNQSEKDFNQSKFIILAKKLQLLFAIKDKCWSYEKEFRVVEKRVIQNGANGFLYNINECSYHISKVICGLNCKEETIDEINQMCNKIIDRRYMSSLKYYKKSNFQTFEECKKQFVLKRSFDNAVNSIKLTQIVIDDNLNLHEIDIKLQ